VRQVSQLILDGARSNQCGGAQPLTGGTIQSKQITTRLTAGQTDDDDTHTHTQTANVHDNVT